MTIVVPSSADNKPAEGAQGLFQASELPAGSRNLNIYPASDFADLPSEGLITGISFRLDEAQGSGRSVDVPEVEIRMSTSPATPTHAYPTFSQNIGAAQTVVFAQGPLHIDALASTSPILPAPFSNEIKLDKPFLYDPRKGSLAVEFRTIRGLEIGLALDAGGNSLSLVAPADRDTPTGALVGFVLQLHVEPLPEPSIIALLLLGSLLSYRNVSLMTTLCERR